VWFDLEGVFGTGLEEPEEIFDNRGSRVVSFKVYEAFTVNGWRVDKGRFLRVVDEIAGVDACRMLAVFRTGF
jgi:hypothetical protein